MKTPFKHFLLILLILFAFKTSIGQLAKNFINPTGTYELKGKTKKRGGEIFGSFGSIQVQMLDSSRIKMAFYICKGAPSYNSGSFIKTLNYDGSKIIFTDTDSTSDCMTTFIFQNKGVSVYENPDVKQFCWGNGVVANGFFKKISNKQPRLKDPLTDEIIKESP